MRITTLPLLLLAACSGDKDDTGTDTDASEEGGPGETGETGETVEGTEHCGTITESEAWSADQNPHVITCELYVEGGTLTIGPGVQVLVASEAGLYVSYEGGEAGLRIEGAADDPVSFASNNGDNPGAWSGIAIYRAADEDNLSLANVTIAHAGYDGSAALQVQERAVAIDGLTISEAQDAGFGFSDGATFAAGSRGLAVTGSARPGYLDPAGAGTLPTEDVDLTGNGDDRIHIASETLDTAVTWPVIGVPYYLATELYLDGTSDDPAVLTLPAGSEVQVATDAGIYLGYNDGAAGLIAEGTADAPVVLRGGDSDNRGSWSGIGARAVQDGDLALTHATISSAGGRELDGAIHAEGAELRVQDVMITEAEGYGFYLTDGAAFAEDSSGLVVTDSDAPGLIAAPEAGSLPEAGAGFTGNEDDRVTVVAEEVTQPAVWGDLGVPYYVYGELYFDGTSVKPAVLTLEPGVELQFSTDGGLYLGTNDGAAGLIAQGTEGAPIVFTGGDSLTRGSWAGIGMYESTVAEQALLDHVEIGYGGGRDFRGLIHVKGSAPTIDNAWLHHSEEYGLYNDEGAPVLGAITYEDNLSGDVGSP